MSGSRECGECRACCTALRVEGVPMRPDLRSRLVYRKQEGEECIHLAPKGPACMIYDVRPKACREWSCGWLTEQVLDEEQRPDRWGIIVDERPPTPGFGPTWMVHETRDGAFFEPGPHAFIETLTADRIVLMAYFDGRRGVRGPGIRAEIHPPSKQHARSAKHHLRVVK